METYILEFWDQNITEEITYLMMTFKVPEEEEKKPPNSQNNKMKFKKVIANYKNFK